MQCVDNGVWTKLSLKCEKKRCGYAGELPHGEYMYEGNSFIGEKVYAKCNEGYTLKGLGYRTCKKSGWTDEIGTCEEGEATCPSPAVANSVSSGGDVPVYQPGDVVTFTCSKGFQLAGAQQVTCGADGQWQPQLPLCLPALESAQPLPNRDGGCGVPDTGKMSNVRLADKYITKTSFASGDRVLYACAVGYTPARGSRFRKCVNGKWTSLHLRCERKTCGSAGEIENGQFDYTGVEFGDTAKAVCDEGFILVGKPTRRCMSKGWDGRIPVCEAVDCGEPPQVVNAEIIDRQEPPFTYRTVVEYRCQVGALNGMKQVWCTSDGTWSAVPTCQEMTTCPSPNISDASWAGYQAEQYPYRQTLSIECNPGYIRTGPSYITCERDGRWSPGLPKCTLKRITYGRSYWRY